MVSTKKKVNKPKEGLGLVKEHQYNVNFIWRRNWCTYSESITSA